MKEIISLFYTWERYIFEEISNLDKGSPQAPKLRLNPSTRVLALPIVPE
jgi:hypothetical protein